jgi:tRNA1Val (adenine37-N6)-methyltransferase
MPLAPITDHLAWDGFAMSLYKVTRVEDLGGGVFCCVSQHHTFGTDAFLLSRFAAPRRHETACDLGTGCGIIPLLWFRQREQAPQWAAGLDIQQEAVFLAQESARRSGLEKVFFPVLGDLRYPKELPEPFLPGGFHLVTCNPPYKRMGTGVISRSESDQVARHEALCTLEEVCAAAARLLRYGGRLCICQLPERLPDLLEAMRRHNIEPKRLRFVQERADTAPWLFLCEGRLGSKPFLQVEKPLLLREQGEDSEEYRKLMGLYRKEA